MVATITRTVPDGPITGSPSAHERWPQSSPRPRLAGPDGNASGFDLDDPGIWFGLASRCLALMARSHGRRRGIYHRDRQASLPLADVLAVAK
ncbi:hypothetical protein QCM77_17900 [Bradyrhizobium sp. SSUT18]|uniref:hypothetical protein n=1 Tax=Bradyrhizobium sp. SSUT18 TaxID=3040602 RepID=UPI00244C97ED|nr:hypothetical protein [Bradyrhizobium sp. SSUT18]MDH2401819.1 hypothetical protein [Bradyrhizobium sp. SSUT18]